MTVNKTVANASLLKELNRGVIFNNIRKLAPISRADLVELTGLGLPTVLRNVNALIEEGYVQEIGKGDTTAGRKPIMLTINPKAAYIAGIHIGKQLSVVLTDLMGEILDDHQEDLDGSDVAQRAEKILSDILKRNSLALQKVAGIGVACASSEDPDGPCAALVRVFSQLPVLSETPTVCCALGEQWFGKTSRAKRSIYLHVDEEITAGIVIDGELYRGKDTLAGQIGHSTIDMSGDRCTCGRRGCLDTYASTPSIVKKLLSRTERGMRSTALDLAGGRDQLQLTHIASAAYAFDQPSVYTLKEAGRALGIGISNLISLLNPDTIVLGGEVIWLSPLVGETAIMVVRENALGSPAFDIEFLTSDIRYYSEARGAAALIMGEVFKPPRM